MQRREAQALRLLSDGPKSTPEIAKRMDISAQHAATILRRLRQREHIAIVGTKPAPGSPMNVWGALQKPQDQFVPIQQKEERDAARQRWLYDILDRWSRFMRSYWGPMGYPTHTPGMAARARIQSFEDLEEEVDRYTVAACDACIDSLHDRKRSAIYFRFGLLDVWKGPPTVQEAFDLAEVELMALLDRKLCAP